MAYGGGLVGLLAFSIWQVGWGAHARFLLDVMPSISCGVIARDNTSIVTYIQDLFVGAVSVGGSPSSLPPLACPISKLVVCIIYAGMILRFYLHLREQNLVLHLVLAILLSLAISPITWDHDYMIAILPFIYLWRALRETDCDLLLLTTVLIVGTDVAIFALRLSTNHILQLILAAIMPCLTIALVYFRAFSPSPPCSAER